MKNDFTPDFGLGSLMDQVTGVSNFNTGLKRNQFVGVDWQYQNVEMTTTTVTLNHQLNKNWTLNTVGSYQNYVKDYYSTERVQWLINTTNDIKNPERSWERPLNKTYNEENYGSLQFNLNGDFKTGNISHKTLIGVDADYKQADAYLFDNPKFYGTNGNTATPSVATPNYILLDNPSTWTSGTIPGANKTTLTRTPTRRIGAYAQDLIGLSKHFKLLAGIRWSYLENRQQQETNYKTGVKIAKPNTSTKDIAFSPRLGLVYQLEDNFTAFASYSNSFVPNTGLDINLKPLDPSTISQYEVGVKKNFLKNAIAVNLTAYQIDNSNLSQPDETDINFRVLAGETRSRGVELDITGNPTNNLSVIGGFSYNHMVYTDTPESKGSFVEGERLVRTPSTTANASVFYTLPKFIKGLKIGATAFYTGDRLAGWNNTKNPPVNQTNRLIELGGYTTVDFSLGYQIKKFLIQGKVGNIFDEKNFNVHENYSVNPIMPRNYYITISYKL